MTLWRALWCVWGSIRRNKRTFALASIGLIIGVATGTFFVALGGGIQQEVLNRIYPVNQIEIEPASVAVAGKQMQVIDSALLGDDMVDELRTRPGVVKVYPKLRSKLQARLWGGKSLFGYDARTEAFFDGLAGELVRDELKTSEARDSRDTTEVRPAQLCRNDEECPLGQICKEEKCREVSFWSRFRDRGMVIPCNKDGDGNYCPGVQRCVSGQCQEVCERDDACGEGRRCVQDPLCSGKGCRQVCRTRCTPENSCSDASFCNGDGVCERYACKLTHARAQFSEKPQDWRGRVTNRCADGLSPSNTGCRYIACPADTYCAVDSVKTTTGYCEAPMPVALSPFLMEVFNSSAVESLGMSAIDGARVARGVQFRVHFGDSYFANDLPIHTQAVKRAEVVGFSNKALDFGFTLPIEYVRALNARYKGKSAATTYSTFILETRENSDVSELLSSLNRTFTLSRKSKDAQKAADLLFILTGVFAFISLVIAGVAAVNIGNTFLMIIAERRYEIGIMRATGASRMDISKLILLEASLLGIFGGLVGEGISYAFSRLVNWLAADEFRLAVYKPDDFFVFDGWVLLGGIAIAWFFCVVGAFIPARRAAKLDPAVVLTS
jgi:ABC-type lipoprotein release transport system permease subunit